MATGRTNAAAGGSIGNGSWQYSGTKTVETVAVLEGGETISCSVIKMTSSGTFEVTGSLWADLCIVSGGYDGGGGPGGAGGPGGPGGFVQNMLAPIIAQAYAGVYDKGRCCDPDEKPVSKEVLRLTTESAGKDAVIARLEAERYADRLIDARIAPINDRICALETASAVNAARDQDFRRYVEREFVHQPKASIRESIVVCKHCGCECESHC